MAHYCYYLLLTALIALIRANYAQFPPKLLPKQRNDDNKRIIKSGQAVTLNCHVERINDDIYFEWTKDGKSLEDYDGRVRITNNGVIKIRHSISEDTGNYMCKAINGFGSVEFSITLIVLDDDYDESVAERDNYKSNHDSDSPVRSASEAGSKPHIYHNAKTTQVIQRRRQSNIKLKCPVVGHPRPTVMWFHNGEQLTDTEARKGRITLIINDLKPEDSGNYTCLAKNSYGEVAYSFILEVIEINKNKPEVDGPHPTNTTVIVGGSATFQCRIKSDGPGMPYIQWLKKTTKTKGDTLNAEEQQHIIKVEGEVFRAIKSSEVLDISDGFYFNKLVIPNVREEDEGKYVCLGANTAGYSTRSAFLTVLPLTKKHIPHYVGAKQELLPFPIMIALTSVLIILLFAVMLWIYCYCHKSETNTRATHSNAYRSPSKQFQYLYPPESNKNYRQVMNILPQKSVKQTPSNELRACSPFYSELITGDKRNSNCCQFNTNLKDSKSVHYVTHKSNTYLC